MSVHHTSLQCLYRQSIEIDTSIMCPGLPKVAAGAGKVSHNQPARRNHAKNLHHRLGKPTTVEKATYIANGRGIPVVASVVVAPAVHNAAHALRTDQDPDDAPPAPPKLWALTSTLDTQFQAWVKEEHATQLGTVLALDHVPEGVLAHPPTTSPRVVSFAAAVLSRSLGSFELLPRLDTQDKFVQKNHLDVGVAWVSADSNDQPWVATAAEVPSTGDPSWTPPAKTTH
ncbi:hypothetical protein BDK51DRAFT_43711 [Blyttiomyces helicus]|uniref:Uncharacterized protein n=1 Tax=Blyttiomyces helicus TaxID=388810 RepID=A0A4P9WIN3_9FUNG|nr:hypothetical protein BDK51DRAFT_43711 [Blyttiomyces helicus]|eukprot:RKO92282.1 hypothetical protein BDK51DRAFT_43711 [Blyttiomyces helicus]